MNCTELVFESLVTITTHNDRDPPLHRVAYTTALTASTTLSMLFMKVPDLCRACDRITSVAMILQYPSISYQTFPKTAMKCAQVTMMLLWSKPLVDIMFNIVVMRCWSVPKLESQKHTQALKLTVFSSLPSQVTMLEFWLSNASQLTANVKTFW